VADIARRGADVVVTLTDDEKRWAVRREVAVPLSSIQSMETVTDPIREIHGLSPRTFNMVGIYLPGRLAIGTFFAGFRRKKTFAAVSGDTPRALRVRLEPGGDYGQLVIGCDDPEAVKAQILDGRAS
jgi:hypothetical protein